MIDVKKIVADKKEAIKTIVRNYPPDTIKLSIIQVGDNPASNSYIKGKLKDCAEVGIVGDLHKLPEDIHPSKVLNLIRELNKDENCKGIIVQLPLPEQFTSEWKNIIFNSISINKDVDGFRKDSPFIPCTPKGVLTIIDEVMEELEANTLNGTVACVIGRSKIVGKPLVNLLIDRGCTVISCNSHTQDLDKWIRESNIIITSVGKPNFLSLENAVKWTNKIVIDVGINRNEDNKLCGDCSPELYNYMKFITPVPNGVGLTTRLSLLENTIKFLK